MNRLPIIGRIALAAALLAVAAIPARSEDAGRVVRLGERLERVPDPAVAGFSAEIDVSALGAASRIELELPGGRLASVVRAELERRVNGDLLWTGSTPLGEEVVLTVSGGRLAGTLFGLERGYRIFPHGEAGHRLLEVDPSAGPDCGGAPVLGPSAEESELSARGGARAAGASANRTPRIDLLVVYADESTAAVGSRRNMRTVVQHFVDLTNVAFHNSEVEARVRLVHTTEVTLPNDVVGDHARILDWLRTSRAIADLRDERGADLVGVVYEQGFGVCGSAAMIYRPGGPTLSRAFFVSRRSCGGDTFAHEVGHLMGADHNPEDANVASGEFLYGRGHYHAGRYRTVMSYATACDQVCPSQPFFSNPSVRYDRRATGLANERDNARILDDFAAEVESFSPPTGSADCGLAPGDPDYCLECGPCVAGEGNCEADSECDSGLVCAAGAGPEAGFPASVNVCRASDGCGLAPGDPDYCARCGPCGFGAGDCDSARECQAGLDCIDDVGATFGLPPAADVCAFREGGYCPLAPGHPDFCTACGPCEAGEGNCKGDFECDGILTCMENVGAELGFRSSTNVCLTAPPSACAAAPGTSQFCKLCGVCGLGEGDCDGDRECADGLTCVEGGGGALGLGEEIDVCLEAGGRAGELAAPKRLKARAQSPTRVRLRWKDKSTNEDGFHVEMSVEGGPFARITSTGANKRKVFVEGLASGTRYTFRVQAFNASGASAYSNERSVTTP